MKSFLTEFKAFAMRGNVVDLAVAVIIGTAFGKIVSSLVDSVVMPVIGILLGGVNFSGLAFEVGEKIVIKYGVFIQSIIDFLIIALVIFLALQGLNKLKRPATKPEDAPVVSDEVKLLSEIRDLLKKG